MQALLKAKPPASTFHIEILKANLYGYFEALSWVT